MTNPTSFRFSDMTSRQLDRLVEITGNTRTEIVSMAIDRMYQQETNTMTTATHTYTVIEDNGGGLHLFIWDEFDDDNAPSYAFHGFEFNPGSLVAALDDLDAGGDPAMWDGASETPVEDWGNGFDGQLGYVTVCHNLDGERVLLTDGMGTAARIEFGIEAA